MKLAPARDNKLIGTVALLNSQRYVVNQLAIQALANIARSNELALKAGKRRIVYLKRHAHGRFVNR